MGNAFACRYGTSATDSHERHLYEMGLASNREVVENYELDYTRFAEENKRLHYKASQFQKHSQTPKENMKKRSRTSMLKIKTSSENRNTLILSKQTPLMLIEKHKVTPEKLKRSKTANGTYTGPARVLNYTTIAEQACKVSSADVYKVSKRYITNDNYPEPGETLLEGRLMKYHPGFGLMYVARDCEVNREYFVYYRNTVTSLKIPLVQLWRGHVASVSKVKISSFRESSEAKYQFEIVMKADWKLGLVYYQENLLYGLDDIEDKRSKNVSVDKFGRIIGAHLMLKPTLLEKYEKGFASPKQKPIESKKLIHIDKIRFYSTKEAEEYKAFMLHNKERLTRISKTEEVEVKNPKRWIGGLGGIHTWSNRELEWYLAEERMLFATETESECDRWILLLNWLIKDFHSLCLFT
eukprot:TRINITY_DN768_c0_g1_i12.p1 TRINITY_DN768_c0_g1~~TRINITY_DN768_c0_g1_i12.p1  ORF type:complete len:410 (-),score=31.79 TRINITY_DN768_c0_g1_i12:123-1352(-)